MSLSTSGKSPREIRDVRLRFKRGQSLKGIARSKGFSINTVRRIVRRTHGYETHRFIFHKSTGPKRGKQIKSEVDGEIVFVHDTNRNSPYPRTVSKKYGRTAFHVYEAKKIYEKLGLPWQPRSCVHHMDNDKLNFTLNNLAVFASAQEHKTFHHKLEQAMLKFLIGSKLIDDFYNSGLIQRPKTLADLLNQLNCEGFTPNETK